MTTGRLRGAENTPSANWISPYPLSAIFPTWWRNTPIRASRPWVNGAPFSFSGKTKPLSKSLETSVHIDLKKLSLPEYLAYSPVKPPVNLASGSLSINSDVTYRISSNKKPALGIKGLFGLDDISVTMKNDQPLFKLPSLQIKASNLELFANRFLFDDITVDGLELYLSRNARGEWMFKQLLPKTAATQKTAETNSTTKPAEKSNQEQPLVQVASFNFNNGIVHFSDAQPAGGFKGTVSEMDAAVTHFTTEANKSAEFELSMLLDSDTTFSADGTFSLTPLAITLSSELSGLKLQRGWPLPSTGPDGTGQGNDRYLLRRDLHQGRRVSR